jgi:peptidoglycan hydrolase-like protein with peptidoglycan-binding domain
MQVGRWMPVVAGAGVLVVVIFAGLSGRGGASSADTVPTTSGVAATVATTGAITAPPIVVDTDPGIVKTSLTHTISKGNAGDDVKAVQQRLTDLGFAPGPIDGLFGSGTQQAVWAYEKLVLKTPRANATGRVTDAMWQVMQDRITIPPRRSTGPGTTHMEIYVPEQVAIVFKDDAPELITHISTGIENPDGTPQKWCETVTYDTGVNGDPLPEPVTKQECADAKTPGGVFRFTRRYTGKRTSPLGGMMNPVYFNYGIAVHGADNVPLEPASHGCVRLNQTIAKVFPSMVRKGDLVYVWGQDGREPEQYSRRDSLPSFNYANPDATTTTESTTTTTAPPTTVKATTTTVKSTTTTPSVTPTTVLPATTTTSSVATTTTALFG